MKTSSVLHLLEEEDILDANKVRRALKGSSFETK